MVGKNQICSSLPQIESRVSGLVPRKGLDGELEKSELRPTQKFEVVGYQYDFHLVRMMSTNRRWQVLNSKILSEDCLKFALFEMTTYLLIKHKLLLRFVMSTNVMFILL